MSVTVRSFAKINIGLEIGAPRPDGFHGLRTLYQTVSIHDLIHVSALPGEGVELRCADARVPRDVRNTCYKVAERFLQLTGIRQKVVIEIDKRLPVQGGMGGGSSNGVAVLFALEKVLNHQLKGRERLRIAAVVGSDLPLFLLGGLTLGVGRGEEVYALPDLPAIPMVIVTPEISCSTPQAFRDWDALRAAAGLTQAEGLARMNGFSDSAFEWLSDGSTTGVLARCGDRAGTLLPDLVRAGIVNDFESVVFPQYPELGQYKKALERHGAAYASLSGSGSTLFGLFEEAGAAVNAAGAMREMGVEAFVAETLPRAAYQRDLFAQ